MNKKLRFIFTRDPENKLRAVKTIVDPKETLKEACDMVFHSYHQNKYDREKMTYLGHELFDDIRDVNLPEEDDGEPSKDPDAAE